MYSLSTLSRADEVLKVPSILEGQQVYTPTSDGETSVTTRLSSVLLAIWTPSFFHT